MLGNVIISGYATTVDLNVTTISFARRAYVRKVAASYSSSHLTSAVWPVFPGALTPPRLTAACFRSFDPHGCLSGASPSYTSCDLALSNAFRK